MKLVCFYFVEGDLIEEEVEEYDELVDFVNGGVLDEDGEVWFVELQVVFDGDYIEDQKVYVGCIFFVNGFGIIEIIVGLVWFEDKRVVIDVGVF